MLKKLKKYAFRPALYEKSAAKFWDDPHIANGMLEAHLDPNTDSATRKHDFINRSVEWVCRQMPPEMYPRLLDLGCGPGLYAERFCTKGYLVTGVDISENSLGYARQQAVQQQLKIQYVNQNYLEITYQSCFDLAVLLYCDYGVLPDWERKIVLRNIYQALSPGGGFILDVFTPGHSKDTEEYTDWSYQEEGFWRKEPHLCLYRYWKYEEAAVYLDQYILITERKEEQYLLWEHRFTADELKVELEQAGFQIEGLYADVAGKSFSPGSEVLCMVAKKPQKERSKSMGFTSNVKK